jgi:hypothetical protein
VVGHILELPDELREELGPFLDDGLEVARDLAGQGEEHIRVLLEFPGQGDDLCLRGGRLLAAFHLAELGRLDLDAGSHLTN